MKIINLINKQKCPFFSFEFFPPANPEDLPAFYETAKNLAKLEPLFVSVTYGAGGGNQDKTLAVATQLAAMGMETMTHLTCVGASRKTIASFLQKLLANDITNVLALRGDPPKNKPWKENEGEFKHAIDLVKKIREDQPEMGIAIAAYPAPHPESASFALDRKYTAEKLQAGADFAITQLFFDVREYVDLVDSLRKKGIDKPIIPGIITIQSFESLRRVLSLCGAHIPAKLYLELEDANNHGGKEAVMETGVRFALEQIRQLLDAGAPGIHLYTLNKSNLCHTLIEESGLKS